MMFRTVLVGATFMRDAAVAAQALCPGLSFVSPLEAAFLVRILEGGDNDYIATYINDTLPRVASSGSGFSASIAIRNDGWNTLSRKSVFLNVTIASHTQTVLLPSDINSGQTIIVTGNFRYPVFKGTFELQYALHAIALEAFKSPSYKTSFVVN